MNFSKREIEIIRLCGWLKVLTSETSNFFTDILSPTEMSSLIARKLIYKVRKDGTYMLTATGWDFLSTIGYDYAKDSRYVTVRDKLIRRKEAGEILFTFYRAGFSVFGDSIQALENGHTYLSSFVARRNAKLTGSKIWAGSTLTGIARFERTAYMIHHTNEKGMYFVSEMNLFHKVVSDYADKTACFYADSSYRAVAEYIINATQGFSDKGGRVDFKSAYERSKIPVHLIECSDVGAVQLRLMSIANYRDELAKFALGSGYVTPDSNLPDTDAIMGGYPLICAIDMDMKRITRAVKLSTEKGYTKINIIALKPQLEALELLLKDVPIVEFFSIPIEKVMAKFDISLYCPSNDPYRNEKGELIHDTDIPVRCKGGRPPKQADTAAKTE